MLSWPSCCHLVFSHRQKHHPKTETLKCHSAVFRTAVIYSWWNTALENTQRLKEREWQRDTWRMWSPKQTQSILNRCSVLETSTSELCFLRTWAGKLPGRMAQVKNGKILDFPEGKPHWAAFKGLLLALYEIMYEFSHLRESFPIYSNILVATEHTHVWTFCVETDCMFSVQS